MLAWIKLLHTAVWLFFASCILALPIAAKQRRFGWALVLSLLVLAECTILALNRFRCPFTDLAARYTTDRAPNFDIYLPIGLARYNQTIFGWLFVAAELFVIWEWWSARK